MDQISHVVPKIRAFENKPKMAKVGVETGRWFLNFSYSFEKAKL